MVALCNIRPSSRWISVSILEACDEYLLTFVYMIGRVFESKRLRRWLKRKSTSIKHGAAISRSVQTFVLKEMMMTSNRDANIFAVWLRVCHRIGLIVNSRSQIAIRVLIELMLRATVDCVGERWWHTLLTGRCLIFSVERWVELSSSRAGRTIPAWLEWILDPTIVTVLTELFSIYF